MIRKAEERDAEDLARIYNHAMRPGIYATADVKPVTRENRIDWLRRRQEPYGAWVSETTAGDVVGWCSLSPFAVRPSYPKIAEISAYVDEAHRSRHVGRELLIHLVGAARQTGFRTLVSLVYEKNVVSIAGCLLYGFRPVATLHHAAILGDVRENVLWIAKNLLIDDPPIYGRLKQPSHSDVARPVVVDVTGSRSSNLI